MRMKLSVLCVVLAAMVIGFTAFAAWGHGTEIISCSAIPADAFPIYTASMALLDGVRAYIDQVAILIHGPAWGGTNSTSDCSVGAGTGFFLEFIFIILAIIILAIYRYKMK